MIPTISVIIPSYNRPQWLSKAIESALNQLFHPIELIVVDDGSPTDQVKKITAHYPQARYIRQDHLGAGEARNTGLAASTGEFVQFLDDDDWLDPSSILLKFEKFKMNPEAECVYSDIYLATEEEKVIGTFYEGWPRPLPQGNVYEKTLRRNFILVHAPLWRKSTLLRAGSFPRRTGAEDWEYLVRCAEFAHFVFLDQPLGYYRLHSKNATLNISQQVAGDGMAQIYIARSPHFRQIPGSRRARILTGYGFQQWLFGDKALGYNFINMARQADSMSLYPIILKCVTLFGRPVVYPLVKILWRIRAKLRSSSGYYFLLKSSH